jgi:predicted GTPase
MGCGASNVDANIAPSSAEETQRNKDFMQQIKASEEAKKAIIKVLLLGAGECGKSTILKQMKIINLKKSPRLRKRENLSFLSGKTR